MSTGERRFVRNKEDFTCEHCGAGVLGDGYTNHCPACLWSKHVDVHPGDRLATCKGLMEPVSVMCARSEYTIEHQCILCGYTKRNKTSKHDSFETILTLSKQIAEK